MAYDRNGALRIRTRGFNSAALELNDHKCAICYLELREPLVQTICGHRFCRDCIVRRNNPRCPIDNEPLLGAERSYCGQGCFPSDSTPPVEPPAEQEIPEQGQQPGYHQEHEGPSPSDKETEESLSQERHPVYQQSDDGQVNGLTILMATGGQAREVSRPIPEMEEIARHLLNAPERQLAYQQSGGGRSNGLSHFLLNGGEVAPRQESISIQEPGTCQLVNGQQQHPSNQLSAQGNVPSYPTQEMRLDVSQIRERQEVCPPIQDTGTAARTPDEHEELPPCRQQLNGVDINGVSSTGQTEQAVESNCSRQELQLWKQKLDRAKPQTATRINPRETILIDAITEVRQRRQGDVNGEPIAFFSSAIYTDSYKYKLGIRVYLNGVENETGRYVAIFVNMMMGEYDNIEVRWPFTQRITLSILDQSGAKRHISQSMQAKPNLSAFQKPTEAISCTGCGFVKFASTEEVFSPHDQYVKDDKLLLKIEFSS